MASLKQELERAEERIECVEYRSAERAGEIEETLDTYVTRVRMWQTMSQLCYCVCVREFEGILGSWQG